MLKDDLELLRAVPTGTDELPRVYAQAQAYAEELRRLSVERQATEAELAAKVSELERSHQQLLAYATDLGALNTLPRATYRPTLEALGRAVDRRDGLTGGHCVRVADYSRVLGERIPIGARIFAAADAFDAMTADRHYRRALSLDEATSELRRNSGTQFDPDVIAVLDELADDPYARRHRE